MRVRHFSIPLLVILMISQTGGAQQPTLSPGGTFFDDDGNVHEGAIEAIAGAGITRGCGADLYCPDRAVTRGEMAAFLVRSLQLSPGTEDAFDDDEGSEFEADVDALAAASITRGCAARRFCPDQHVSRGEMAAFLSRAFELSSTGAVDFVDDDGSVFEDDIGALGEAGFTLGCNPPVNDRFCPGEQVSRAQMASFLARALRLTVVPVPNREAFEIAFTGDTLIHGPVYQRAAVDGARSGEEYDFRPMFSPVADLIGGADLALCHLEVPLAASSRNLSGYPRFNAPAELADDLVETGYDGCSTASNHSADQGVSGIIDTLTVLDAAGLTSTGMWASEEDAGTPSMYNVGDVVVAHLSATFSLNGIELPSGREWMVQMLDVAELLERARRAKHEDADFVVVSVHCCAEYQSSPTAYQREVDHRLIESPDIDLVVGHHAHVIQPVEKVGDEYIIYGLGNFLSGQQFSSIVSDGVVIFADVAQRGSGWRVRGIAAAPTKVTDGTFRIVPVAGASASAIRTMKVLRSIGVAVELR